ncbi:PBP1A family penicillin-binding protein [Vagococcus luciliae]|uniref:Penicillin-binding protein 1A n=1 Tax=Vagococcus luciliae TaxID=2920380 RepID=A0ABY5P218_9ENTE|nr:PBP1A family penicillin-binding protein [Vagococcus luciliae]UUV99778.1 Penicillin-binding protein 1A [Vagococcus luciliae]
MKNSSNGKKEPQKRQKRNVKKGILIFLAVLLALIVIPVIGGAGLFFYYAKDAPTLDYKKLEDTRSSKIYAMNGDMILEIGEKKREIIEPNQIPPMLKEAIISIEDKRFEKHKGVDPIRIAGAAISNIKGTSRQGGSTLTQQLIKLSFFSTKKEDQTIKRKAQEAWLAVELEQKKSKDEILTYYINRVYMANGIYGMQTAAKNYFNKNLDELSLAQYALLAGMPQAPIDYDPYTHPDMATKRRDLVLSEMLKDKIISQKEYEEAKGTKVEDGLMPLKKDSTTQVVTDNYVKQVIDEVQSKTNKNVYTDGLDIYTNMDLDAQTYLYNLVNSDESAINFPDDEFQATATLIDVKNGDVRAQIGGRKLGDGALNDNKAVTAKRNIGSTAKPLVAYAPTIEDLNYGSGQIYADMPYQYSDGTEVYDYDRSYRGNLTMRESLVDSRNIPALKALKEVGDDKSKDFISSLGLTNKVYEGTAIGFESSSEKLAASYAAFANGGIYYEPSYVNKVVYSDGTEESFDSKGQRAMKESTAFIITDMLKDVINRGTGTQAQINGIVQAGKTGTSNYDDDVLYKVKGEGSPDITFVGYTPKYSLAVWTGYDDYFQPITLYNQQLAMDIYREFMSYLYQNIEPTDWKQPSNVVRIGNEVYVKGHTQQTQPSYNYYKQSEGVTDYNYYQPEESKATKPSSKKEETKSEKKEETPEATKEKPTTNDNNQNNSNQNNNDSQNNETNNSEENNASSPINSQSHNNN